MFITGIILLLVSVIFMANEAITYRYTISQEVSDIGKFVAENVESAILENDKKAAETVLNSLTHYSSIVSAVIFNENGNVFAHYPGKLDKGLGLLQQGKYLVRDHVHTYDTIRHQNKAIGTVYMKSDLSKLYSRLFVFGRILIVVILCVFLIALQIANRMHRIISDPILRLTDFSKRVSESKNYSIRAVKQSDDEVGELTDTINDMLSTIEETQEKLHYQAFHDSLTGLPNRPVLYDRIEKLLQYGKRNPGYRFAVIFLDLDRFKLINDSLGHVQGDELLKQFSSRLKTVIRELDTVTRLGGDEFVILMGEIEKPRNAVLVADRVQAILKEPFILDGQKVFVTASLGITYNHKSYSQAADILRDADNAMYSAKSLGKARYQIFDKQMHLNTVKTLKLETDLRTAIAENEFVLHYQPIYGIKEKKINRLEALLRWEHPKRGMIFPGDFIPLAEETGLILDIGKIVFDMVCTQIGSWKKNKVKLVETSINFSTKQFEQKGLIKYLKEKTLEKGVEPSMLGIEITENTAINDVDHCVQLINQIKDIGIHFFLDDFGTGFSSLSCLNALPVDYLKIDRSLIELLSEDKQDKAITKAIIDMSHDLGFKVVAEGVETKFQLDMLTKFGCDEVQGYLFSKAVPPDEIEKML